MTLTRRLLWGKFNAAGNHC